MKNNKRASSTTGQLLINFEEKENFDINICEIKEKETIFISFEDFKEKKKKKREEEILKFILENSKSF